MRPRGLLMGGGTRAKKQSQMRGFCKGTLNRKGEGSFSGIVGSGRLDLEDAPGQEIRGRSTQEGQNEEARRQNARTLHAGRAKSKDRATGFEPPFILGNY